MLSSTPFTPIRRVVTGHDAAQTAQVISDGAARNERVPMEGMRSTLIWSTDHSPAIVELGLNPEDMGDRILGIQPPPNGSRFVINDFAPGEGHMHRTDTIDYIVVLAGEIDCDLDRGSVTLRAGDVAVQRGTNHAWINRSGAAARLAFVLIDAVKPLAPSNPEVRS